MTDTRTIIDYAADDNGSEMRNALYANIHDRVTAHLDNMKQQIAKNLIAPEEESETSTEE